MRARSILMAFLLALAATWGSLPRATAAAAGGSCLPTNRLPVTVLVRSAAGRPWLPLETDGPLPFIDGDTGRTIVPLRALTTALAPGSDNVRWYDDLRTASFWYQGHTLSIRFPRDVDRTYTATLDKQPYSLTSYLCNSRVWVTARTVVEAYHIDIQYDGGYVLIDGAGQDPQARQTSRKLSDCSAFPEGTDYLLAPAASARQAATTVACQLVAAR